MVNDCWEFWRLTRTTDGVLEWLAVTRPAARARIDRLKMWTLIPDRRVFLANWYVTEDHRREDGMSMWIHDNIDLEEAREVALEVPQVSAADLGRLLRPEAGLTLDQIDRHPVTKILGTRVAGALAAR